MRRVRKWLRCGRASSATSRVLVSLYVQQDPMTAWSLSRSSRRVLLTTSIWSVILVAAAVFLTYSVLLVWVSHPFQHTANSRSIVHDSSPRMKLKFTGRNLGFRNGLQLSSGLDQGHKFWDPGLYGKSPFSAPDCQPRSLMVVLITSAPDHFEQRLEIRRTWCNLSVLTAQDGGGGLQCVFLIGEANSSMISIKLKEEGNTHKDILRGSYVDSYRNLTVKVMHGLSWVSTSCKTEHVLKTDDDCYVNTLLMQQFLSRHHSQSTNLYAGNMVARKTRLKVIRNPGEKWFVAKEEYGPDYYPMYASGSGYAISMDVVSRLVRQSRTVPLIANEDAYMGILMERLGVERTVSGRFALSSYGLRLCNYLYILVLHGVKAGKQQEEHSKALAAQTQCHTQEVVSTWF